MKGFRIFYRPAKAEIIGTKMEMTKAAIAIIRVTLLSIISSCVFLHSITAVRLARLSYATKRVIYGCVYRGRLQSGASQMASLNTAFFIGGEEGDLSMG